MIRFSAHPKLWRLAVIKARFGDSFVFNATALSPEKLSEFKRDLTFYQVQEGVYQSRSGDNLTMGPQEGDGLKIVLKQFSEVRAEAMEKVASNHKVPYLPIPESLENLDSIFSLYPLLTDTYEKGQTESEFIDKTINNAVDRGIIPTYSMDIDNPSQVFSFETVTHGPLGFLFKGKSNQSKISADDPSFRGFLKNLFNLYDSTN